MRCLSALACSFAALLLAVGAALADTLKVGGKGDRGKGDMLLFQRKFRGQAFPATRPACPQ